MSTSPTSPFWVSNTAHGTSTLYNAAGVPTALVAIMPPSATRACYRFDDTLALTMGR